MPISPYPPYFSATAVNVGHGFWSHDIEGPANNEELYTRWIQIGAFSGEWEHTTRVRRIRFSRQRWASPKRVNILL